MEKSTEERLREMQQEIKKTFATAAYKSIANKERWLAQFTPLMKMGGIESAAQALCDIWYQHALIAEALTERWLTPAQYKEFNNMARDYIIVSLCARSKENPIAKFKNLFDGVEVDEWVNEARKKVLEKEAERLNKDIQKGMDAMQTIH